MAKVRAHQGGAPDDLAVFDRSVWGEGDEGIEAWKRACLDYLDADPMRRLPIGADGDKLAVIRASVALKGGFDWPVPEVRG